MVFALAIRDGGKGGGEHKHNRVIKKGKSNEREIGKRRKVQG